MSTQLVWVQVVRPKHLLQPAKLHEDFIGLTFPALVRTKRIRHPNTGAWVEVACVPWPEAFKIIFDMKRSKARTWYGKHAKTTTDPYLYLPLASVDPSVELRRTRSRRKPRT